MKVVINNKFGGFGLSYKAIMLYAKLKGITLYPYVDEISQKVYGEKPLEEYPFLHYSTEPVSNEDELNAHYFSDSDIERTDPFLIEVIKQLKDKANGSCAKLKIIEIPDDIEWEVKEYDGNEWIAEKHRTWG